MFHVIQPLLTLHRPGRSPSSSMADQEPLQLICTWEHSVQSVFISAANGSLPKPPVRVENVESWLIFTDLVFIDPIGTGFSRSLPQTKIPKINRERKPTE